MYPGEENYYARGNEIPSYPTRSRRSRPWLIVIAILLVIGVGVGGFLIGHRSPPNLPVAVPTATPCGGPCPVYVENDWQGWALSSDWRINGTLLSEDGSAESNQGGPSAISPYTLPPGKQHFAIEVEIAVPRTMLNGHFSITACGSTSSTGWQGYEGLIGYNFSNHSEASILADQSVLAQADFTPDTAFHTYRLEVSQGNIFTLYVDKALVAQATDSTPLPCGSQIGLVSSNAAIQVSKFKVFLL